MQKPFVPHIFESPNHRYKVVVVWFGYDRLGWPMHEVRVTNGQGKVLTSWQGYHRNTDVIWASDCTMVAVNDRQTNGGDYVYVVALAGNSAKIVRMPEQFFDIEALFHKRVFLGKVSDLTRFSINAVRFLLGGELEISVYVQTNAFMREKSVFVNEQAILLFDASKRSWRIFYKGRNIS